MGSFFNWAVGPQAHVKIRVSAGLKFFDVMKQIFNVTSVSLCLNMELDTYGDVCGVNLQKQRGGETLFVIIEMKYLQSTLGVTSLNREKKEEKKLRLSVRENMNVTVHRKDPKQLGHGERMSEEHVTKRVYALVLEGGRNGDDHRMSSMDKVKKSIM